VVEAEKTGIRRSVELVVGGGVFCKTRQQYVVFIRESKRQSWPCPISSVNPRSAEPCTILTEHHTMKAY
jgi:hypothetical protein